MWLFNGSSSAPPAQPVQAPAQPPATLLVIQADDYDWAEILKDATLSDGRKIKVVQVGWDDIQVHADTYSSTRLCVEVRKLARTASGAASFRPSSIQPDFVLVRNEVTTPHFDGRSLLSGLMFADVPAVNSLESIHMFTDRAAVMGRLHRLHRRVLL